MYDLIICPILFSCWGTENSRVVPNHESMEGDRQFKATCSHTQQPLQPQACVQEHCPGETGLPSSVFQTVSEMSLSTTIQSPALKSPVWVYLEGNTTVSIRKG